MRLTPLRRAGLLASAAVAAVATLALATTALAQPEVPITDDERAEPFLKNVDINHPDACTVGGLTGTTVHPNEFEFDGGDNQVHLDITGLPEDIEITGIVVKGGDKFNVYLVEKLGETLPWEDLRSPFNNGGQLPQISHWYGCGIVDETPSSSVTPTTTTTSTETQSSAPTSTSSTTSAPSSSGGVAPTTTTTVAVVPVAAEDDLAATGFGSAWLLGLGAALVAAGAAVMLVMRRRRA